MTIIQIEALGGLHRIERQSGRRACWLEGYIEVPVHLEAEAWETRGYCDLTIEGGKLVGVTPTERPPQPGPTNEERIAALKAELTATDYQVIKCSEYQAAGLEMPYDIVRLHAKRQAIRDEINTLEVAVENSTEEGKR